MDCTTSLTTNAKRLLAVIYCRVSSDRQVKEGDGLGSQETRCREYARQQGYEVVRIFQDKGVSGKLIERQAFQEMVGFLEARKEPFVVIIDNIDRFARDVGAHHELRMRLKLIGAKLECPNFTFGDEPHEVLIENVMASMAQYQREHNAMQVRNRTKARMQQGFCTNSVPPHGYKRIKHPEYGKHLVKDEVLAPVIQEALESFASGRFATQKQVKQFLESSPFPKGRTGRVTFTQVKSLLTNVLYAGYVKYEKWGVPLTKAKHEAIISLQTHQKILDRLNGTKVVTERKDKREDFPLRGSVLCSSCGNPLTASWSKGRNKRYPFYHCKQKPCKLFGKSIRRDEMESKFLELLDAVSPSPTMLELTRAIVKDVNRDKAKQFRSKNMANERKVRELEKKRENLIDLMLDADMATVKSSLRRRLDQLEKDITLLREDVQSDTLIDTTLDSAVGTVFEFMKKPRRLWEQGSLEDKQLVLRLTFAKKLRYHRDEGFGTADLSLPFSVMAGLKSSEYQMGIQERC